MLTVLTSFSGKSALFDHLVNALSRLDIFKGVALMCLFWYAWAQVPANETSVGLEERQRRLIRVLIGTILLGALSRVLQLVLVLHERPVFASLGLPFAIPEFDAGNLNTWNSLPSDHSMFFFALGTGLWAVKRGAGLIAFI